MINGRYARVGSMHARTIAVAATAALALTGAAACGSNNSPSDADKIRIVAALYPLQFLAESIGGDRVTVTNMVPPGAEPHGIELNPSQVAEIANARLVVYISGFQPAVDEAVEQEARGTAFDAATLVTLLNSPAEGHEEGPTPPTQNAKAPATGKGKGPHLWLDPVQFGKVADTLAEELATTDPSGAVGYRERAAGLRAKLTALDAEYEHGLKTCQRRQIVVSHAAFGYLAERYKLEQIPITGLFPEVEPTPPQMADVAARAKKYGATTIFFETLASPKVAEAIAAEVKARTAVLDPIERLQAGTRGDYLSVMRTNLPTLRSALGCT
jgi:zinc transport system substrate-binding protein